MDLTPAGGDDGPGRSAPLKEVYETAVAGSEEEKKTRNVVKTTLPDKLGVRPIGDKLFLKSGKR